MDLRHAFSSLGLGLGNSAWALAAAFASFFLMHGALALFRKRLGKLSEQSAHRAVAEVLRDTLARTSTLAVVATAGTGPDCPCAAQGAIAKEHISRILGRHSFPPTIIIFLIPCQF